MVTPAFRKRASALAIVSTLIAIPCSSQANAPPFAERAATEAPAPSAPPTTCISADKCCRVCSAGKACGNSCIQATKTCHKGRGSACDESEICDGS